VMGWVVFILLVAVFSALAPRGLGLWLADGR
jgi:hypothetical protein